MTHSRYIYPTWSGTQSSSTEHIIVQEDVIHNPKPLLQELAALVIAFHGLSHHPQKEWMHMAFSHLETGLPSMQLQYLVPLTESLASLSVLPTEPWMGQLMQALETR